MIKELIDLGNSQNQCTPYAILISPYLIKKRIIDNYSHYKINPSFEIKQSQIRVILPVTSFDYKKLDKKEAIVAYLQAFPKSSRQSIENAIQIEKSSLIRRLNELEKFGIIQKHGNGPSTLYFCK